MYSEFHNINAKVSGESGVLSKCDRVFFGRDFLYDHLLRIFSAGSDQVPKWSVHLVWYDHWTLWRVQSGDYWYHSVSSYSFMVLVSDIVFYCFYWFPSNKIDFQVTHTCASAGYQNEMVTNMSGKLQPWLWPWFEECEGSRSPTNPTGSWKSGLVWTQDRWWLELLASRCPGWKKRGIFKFSLNFTHFLHV